MMHIQQFHSIPEFLSRDACEEIINCESNRVMDSYSTTIRGGISRFNPLDRFVKSGWMYKDRDNAALYARLWHAVNEVNDRAWKFELADIETLQYLDYGFLNHYGLHVDNGDDQVAKRKLSVIIQLNEPFEYVGCKTRIHSMSKRRYAADGLGDLTIFPSHLPHKVTPLLWGRRRCLVAWVRGERPLR